MSAGVGLADGVGVVDEGVDGKVGGHPKGVEGQLPGGGPRIAVSLRFKRGYVPRAAVLVLRTDRAASVDLGL